MSSSRRNNTSKGKFFASVLSFLSPFGSLIPQSLRRANDFSANRPFF